MLVCCVLVFRKMSPHRVWPIVEHKSIQCLQQTQHLCLMCFICSMHIVMRKCIHMWLKPILDDFHTFQQNHCILQMIDHHHRSNSLHIPYALNVFCMHGIQSFLIFQKFTFSSIISIIPAIGIINKYTLWTQRPLELLLLLLACQLLSL